MIDRPGRDLAADLLEKLADGLITNDEFEDAYPRSGDRAVRVIRDWAWHHWDDMYEHRLAGRFALSAAPREGFRRCALFLKSELAYQWPPHPLGPLGSILAHVILLPPLSLIASWWAKKYETAGDFEVWPFLRSSDFEEVRQLRP